MIKTFDEIQLKDDKDLELPFSVPPNLESVSVHFEASIFNISQQKTERLTSKYKVDLKTNNDQLTFYDSYLKKVDNKYKFLILGKNGEPIPNIDVLFTFIHCLYSSPNKQIHLTTNEKGTIELGELDGIKSIQFTTVTYNSTMRSQMESANYLTTVPVSGTWHLPNTNQKNTFPEKIEILESEEIEFPFVKAISSSEF